MLNQRENKRTKKLKIMSEKTNSVLQAVKTALNTPIKLLISSYKWK